MPLARLHAPLCPQIFFDALLPPIIFNAGFSVKKKNFFRNFCTLVLFGVVGTFMTAAMVAAGAPPALMCHRARLLRRLNQHVCCCAPAARAALLAARVPTC